MTTISTLQVISITHHQDKVRIVISTRTNAAVVVSELSFPYLNTHMQTLIYLIIKTATALRECLLDVQSYYNKKTGF